MLYAIRNGAVSELKVQELTYFYWFTVSLSNDARLTLWNSKCPFDGQTSALLEIHIKFCRKNRVVPKSIHTLLTKDFLVWNTPHPPTPAKKNSTLQLQKTGFWQKNPRLLSVVYSFYRYMKVSCFTLFWNASIQAIFLMDLFQGTVKQNQVASWCLPFAVECGALKILSLAD